MLGGPIQRIIPAYLSSEEAEIDAAIARGERIEPYETIRIGKDGRRIAISLSVTPLKDAEGRVYGASKVARDMTLRRQAEDALRVANGAAREARLQTEAANRAQAQALAALRHQSQLRAIVDTAVDGIILMDSTGQISLFNPACERIFGYAAHEVLGTDVKRLMPSPYRQEHDQYLENYRRTGQRQIIGAGREVTGLRKSGETFPLDLSVGEFEIDGVTSFVGVLRDVSARKRAEAQREQIIVQLSEANALARTATDTLVRSERLTRTIIDAIPDHVVYFNADLTIRAANKSFCAWYGVSPEIVVGTGMVDLLGDETLSRLRPHIDGALAGESHTFERSFTSAKGELQHSLTDYIPDVVDGKVAGFVVKVTNVSPLKATEAALRAENAAREQANASLHRSRLALKEAQRLGQIGSWERQIDGGEVIWSEGLNRIYGRDPEAEPPVYSELAKFYPPESWSQLNDAVERAWTTGEPYTLELPFFSPDGQTSWIEARGEAVCDASGGVVSLRGTAQDITARRLAAEQREDLIEQLTAANVERAHFARAASHDMREPLRMVTAYCGRLSKGYADRLDDKGVQYLDLAVDAATRMNRILDDLVDFERLAEGARGGWFQAGVAVEAALADLKERIRVSGATINVGPLPRLWGNSIRFERLMQNLIGNAMKYMAAGVAPRINVRAERDQDFWRFSVSDNGIGIEPRHRERIFEPFKRLHGGDQYDGTGLGLAICKKIVEGLGGWISVESNPGGGSIFNFTVKIKQDGGA